MTGLIAVVVTAWPERLALTAGFALLAIIAAVLMRSAWRGKQANQSQLPAPAAPPTDFVGESVPGRYVGTAFAGDWLARVVVHGLGLPSRAQLEWSAEGLAIRPVAGPAWFVPTADLVEVRADRAAAGKVYEKDGMIVLKWRLGTEMLESGFRAASTADHLRCLQSLNALDR